MTPEEMYEAAERLNRMGDEVIRFNIQGGSREDHIGAAEAQLAFYEASLDLQLTVALERGVSVEDEGSMAFYRRAAELHVAIAEAMR